MKHEDRILKLLAETLQRIDRYSEVIERQQEAIRVLLMQKKNQQRIDQQGEALGALRERTESMPHNRALTAKKFYSSPVRSSTRIPQAHRK